MPKIDRQKLSLPERITKLFQDKDKSSKDELRQFVELLRNYQADADRLVIRRLWIFVLYWLVFYGIGGDIINEGSLASFKLENIEKLLIFAPPLIAFQYYLIATAYGSKLILENAVRQCYKNALPKVYELDLEYILRPPTFLNIEELIEVTTPKGWMSRLHAIWAKSIYVFVALGIIGCIVHTSYMLFSANLWPWYFNAISIMVAVVVMFKGFIVFWSTVKFSY